MRIQFIPDRVASLSILFCILMMSNQTMAMNSTLSKDQILAHAIEKLSDQSGIASDKIKVLEIAAVTWPNSSLGCPEPDMMYAQVLTPGFRIQLEADGQSYWLHTGGNVVVICKNPSADIPAQHLLPDEQKF